jgi:mannose-6-phosphate isomerase-like protein (cupin superfamily)
VRGSVKREYKTGDVIQVSEGTTHHAENYGTIPAVYIEINTTAAK